MRTKAEQQEIAFDLIEWALSFNLMKNFEQFTDIDQKWVVNKMIEFTTQVLFATDFLSFIN